MHQSIFFNKLLFVQSWHITLNSLPKGLVRPWAWHFRSHANPLFFKFCFISLLFVSFFLLVCDCFVYLVCLWVVFSSFCSVCLIWFVCFGVFCYEGLLITNLHSARKLLEIIVLAFYLEFVFNYLILCLSLSTWGINISIQRGGKQYFVSAFTRKAHNILHNTETVLVYF